MHTCVSRWRYFSVDCLSPLCGIVGGRLVGGSRSANEADGGGEENESHDCLLTCLLASRWLGIVLQLKEEKWERDHKRTESHRGKPDTK